MNFQEYLEMAVAKKKPTKKGPDYSEVAYKIDKWMPDDSDLIQEFQDIEDSGNVEDMAEHIEMNADDEMLSRYMPKGGTIMGLAKFLLGKK